MRVSTCAFGTHLLVANLEHPVLAASRQAPATGAVVRRAVTRVLKQPEAAWVGSRVRSNLDRPGCCHPRDRFRGSATSRRAIASATVRSRTPDRERATSRPDRNVAEAIAGLEGTPDAKAISRGRRTLTLKAVGDLVRRGQCWTGKPWQGVLQNLLRRILELLIGLQSRDRGNGAEAVEHDVRPLQRAPSI
jgi:hypothetical protein